MHRVLLVCTVILCVGCASYTVVPTRSYDSDQVDTSQQPFFAPDGIEFTEDFDVEPKIVHQTPPKYPQAARAAELEGVVILMLGIDDSGYVVEAKVAQGREGLSGAALAAVRDWRFVPAMRAGKPVAVRVPVPIRFTLRG